jgi:predicted glutamine amidotransferase
MNELSERGKDTWGISALPSNSKDLFLKKGIGKLNSLSNKSLMFKLILSGYTRFIFHSRLATSGLAGLKENIQPIFIEPNFLLVHNGLLLKNDVDCDNSMSDSFYLALVIQNSSQVIHESILLDFQGEVSMIMWNSNQIFAFTNVGNIYSYCSKNFYCLTSEPRLYVRKNLKKDNYMVKKLELNKLQLIG